MRTTKYTEKQLFEKYKQIGGGCPTAPLESATETAHTSPVKKLL